jgi:nucleolar protein 56
VFGEKLRQQVEDRLKFYETGEIPRKNIDVMKEAVEEVQQVGIKLTHCMGPL